MLKSTGFTSIKGLTADIPTATTAAIAAQQQSPITLSGNDAKVSVQNIDVTRGAQSTLVTMDFILDSLDVPSNRYRAFTPVIRSTDGQHEQHMKTLIISGRRQNIVFERDGIDPLYADNCVNLRRQNGTVKTYNYSDAVQNQPWFRDANVYVECDL